VVVSERIAYLHRLCPNGRVDGGGMTVNGLMGCYRFLAARDPGAVLRDLRATGMDAGWAGRLRAAVSARFDLDGDGKLSEGEFVRFLMQGLKIRPRAVQKCWDFFLFDAPEARHEETEGEEEGEGEEGVITVTGLVAFYERMIRRRPDAVIKDLRSLGLVYPTAATSPGKWQEVAPVPARYTPTPPPALYLY
jgi:hypothetical protein